MTASVRSHAAALQLTSIKFELANVLAEIRFGDAAATTTDDVERAALLQHGEKEALKVMAMRLEQFIQDFQGTAEAEGARALLARIYIKLEKPAEAARVLRDFDASLAAMSDILKVALLQQAVADLNKRLPIILEEAVEKGKTISDKFQAVFVATKLGDVELAAKLLKQIKTAAKTIEEKAEVVLCEGELVSWIDADLAKAEVEYGDVGSFVENPLTTTLLARPGAVAIAKRVPVVKRIDAGGGAVEAAAPHGDLIESELMKIVAADAADGVRSLEALARNTGSSIPVPLVRFGRTTSAGLASQSDATIGSSDAALMLRAGVRVGDVLTAALLHSTARFYPGTPAAKIAVAKLRAYRTRPGDYPMPFVADTMNGDVVDLAALRGRVVLVDFWSVSDKVSMEERVQLAKVFEGYRYDGFEIISISLDSADEMTMAMAANEATGANWPQVFEGKGLASDIARRWGVDTAPTRVLIGRDGRIAEICQDRLSADSLQDLVVAALRTTPDTRGIDPVLGNPRMPDPVLGRPDLFKPSSIKEEVIEEVLEEGRIVGIEPGPKVVTGLMPDALRGGSDEGLAQFAVLHQGPRTGKVVPAGTEGFDATMSLASLPPVVSPIEVSDLQKGLPDPFEDAIGGSAGSAVVFGPTPAIECSIVAIEGKKSVEYQLTCSTMVPTGGYELRLDRQKADGELAVVFVSQIAPDYAKPQIEAFQTLTTKIALGSTPRKVALYFREVKGDEHYLVDPAYQLAAVLPIPEDGRLAYVGPRIISEIVEKSEKSGKDFALDVRVLAPEPGYTWEVVTVEKAKGVTQVKLRLVAPAKSTKTVQVETKTVRVELGKEIGEVVEVLVATKYWTTKPTPDEFALAGILKKKG